MAATSLNGSAGAVYVGEVHNAQPDRRSGTDRRTHHGKAFLCQFFMRRRHGDRRRNASTAAVYVDVHEPALLLVVLLTLLFCVSDGYMTLTLLHHGGEELNPLMRHLIELDTYLFFVGKYVITAISLIVLVSHKNFVVLGRVSGYHVLYVVLAVYSILISYECVLLSIAAPASA